MYMPHRHIICWEFHTCHYLISDQTVNDNSYSTPLSPWGFGCKPQNGNVGNWLVSQYIFTHFCATSALSWTWYCLSVHFLSINIFCICPDQWHHFCKCYFVRCCWNSLVKLTSLFWLPVCICIWESNLFVPGSWTLDIIDIYIALVDGNETINHIFDIYRCTDTTISYN